MTLSCLLVAEGRSDRALAEHLERLCLACGASRASVLPVSLDRLSIPPGHQVEEKLRAVIERESVPKVLFVHRDADQVDSLPRRQEIVRAARLFELGDRCVPIVPVQMTGAWLLLDENAIRRVVGKPSGKEPLGLPAPRDVERHPNPKALLEDALLRAVGAKGRRHRRARRNFGLYRKLLLTDLPLGGPLEQVPSWVRLRDDIKRVLESRRA